MAFSVVQAFATLLVALWLVASTARSDTAPTGAGGTVASVHRLATEAGQAVLRRGGNAVDAAVATALTLGVVDGCNPAHGRGG